MRPKLSGSAAASSVGVMDLAQGAEALYLADEDRLLADGEALHPVLAVAEPLEGDLAGAVGDDHLVELAALARRDGLAGRDDLPGEDLDMAFAQLAYAAEIAAVFVAVRQGVEGVLDGGDAHLGEFFDQAGADPPYLVDGRGQQLAAATGFGGESHLPCPS